MWRAGRREFLLTGILQALSSAALAVQLLAARRLLAVLLATRSGGNFGGAVVPIILIAVAVAVVSAANVGRFELQQLLGELIGREAMATVVRKASKADLLDFENPEYHNRLQRALYNGTARPLQLVTGLLSLIGAVMAVAGIGLTMILIQPLVFALAVVAVIPVSLATTKAGKALYRFGFLQTGRDRRRAYLQYLLTERDAAKELRAYQLSDHLLRRFLDLYALRVADLRATIKQRVRQGLAGSLLTSVLSGGSIAFLVWLIANGHLSLADAGTAAAGLLLLGSQLQGIASGMGSIYESSLFVQDFVSFVEEPVAAADPVPLPAVPADWSEVKVTDVHFTYPAACEPALRGVSMTIARGEVVALVGENGSGKSTLAKVIAGLYPPSEGTVTWDGLDARSLEPSSRADQVAVLFQDFLRYSFSALENITLGSWAQMDDRERAMQVALEAGARAVGDNLPQGWDTQLGPQFEGGIDLSGGQWQRVAMARAMFRGSPLVILDEPTAALDPRTEAEMFGAVRRLFAGRSVVLITHRFTSARLADRIYVLDSGRVVEEGAHDELVRSGGLYSELYGIQAELVTGTSAPRLRPKRVSRR